MCMLLIGRERPNAVLFSGISVKNLVETLAERGALFRLPPVATKNAAPKDGVVVVD